MGSSSCSRARAWSHPTGLVSPRTTVPVRPDRRAAPHAYGALEARGLGTLPGGELRELVRARAGDHPVPAARRRVSVRARARGGAVTDRMDPDREDTARWLDEGRELLALLHEQVEHLAQENERLRAELRLLDELQAVIARVNQDNDRLRAERDELLAAFRRLAELAEELRRSSGGGLEG